MPNIFANTPAESDKVKALLQESLPMHRKAYSDRTAWLMACFSELAYIRFNPFAVDAAKKDYFIKAVSKLAGQKKATSVLKLVDSLAYDHIKEEKKLLAELDIVSFTLEKTFDENGTQAILASNGQYLVLAFRGTEATSIKDIKADLKAQTTASESGGKIHSGFKEAFGQVVHAIQNTLEQEGFKDMPLFIAGHSLGGALATIAAKELSHEGGIAACYTFGSPRVGNDVWASSMKTPIYRVVNAADGVTMVPPGGKWIRVLAWLLGKIPLIGKPIRSFLSNFMGYIHAGDMRYLTNCRKGQYTGVKLLYSVGILYRLKGLYTTKKPWLGFLTDHSISIYRKKLMLIAQRRNKR